MSLELVCPVDRYYLSSGTMTQKAIKVLAGVITNDDVSPEFVYFSGDWSTIFLVVCAQTAVESHLAWVLWNTFLVSFFFF